jgi:hypothetical protein
LSGNRLYYQRDLIKYTRNKGGETKPGITQSGKNMTTIAKISLIALVLLFISMAGCIADPVIQAGQAVIDTKEQLDKNTCCTSEHFKNVAGCYCPESTTVAVNQTGQK